MIGNRLNITGERIRTLRDYPNSLYFNSFDFAIMAGGYNSYHEAIAFQLPTICLPNKNTGMDDQVARANVAGEACAMYVIQDITEDKLSDAITSMMDIEKRKEFIEAMTHLEKANGADELSAMIIEKRMITASMAAVPWREDALLQVVDSLLPQVDRLNIYLNEWDRVPDFLNQPKINAVMSQNEVGDIGDKGKFFWCEQIQGFHLTVDDDILYPCDYVEKILYDLSRYPKAVVSYHGSILNYPVFNKRNSKLTHFSRDASKDIAVALIGTGVLAYDADQLDVEFSGFKSNYWADGWFSLQARNASFRCIVIRHNKDWLIPLSTKGPDIWSMNQEKSREQQINQWINKYKLWDEMTLFSELIRDRNLRWWVHKDKVNHKNVGGKIEGAKFVKEHDYNTPNIYYIDTSLESLPRFDQLGENFVIKLSQGYSSQNVFVMKKGINLFDGKTWNRQEIIDKLSISSEINNDENLKFIVEELLLPWDGSERIPYDYKFYMFGSEIAYCHIIDRRSSDNPLLNRNWYVDIDFSPIENQIMIELLPEEDLTEKPDCWDELVAVAKDLGGSLNRFTRVDLFATNRGVVFGEFSPTPHGGRGFTKWADMWLGDMWQGVEGAGD